MGCSCRWQVWASRKSRRCDRAEESNGKAERPVVRQRTAHAAAPPEIIEMRYGFAHREELLLEVERAPKQDRHHLRGRDRRPRRGDRLDELRQPCVMMRAQLADPKRDAAKRQAMRGKHERVGTQNLE